MDIVDNLFSQQKWTIFIKTSSEEVYQSEDSAVTDNYIIFFTDEHEFYEILMYLKKFRKWNPAGKFIVTSGTVFENPYEVAVNITSTLWSFRVTHYVIMLVNSSELQLLDIYIWHPYTNGHCADQFNETKVVNQCKDGVMQYDTNLFPIQMLNNLNGCTINAQAIRIMPFVIIPTDIGTNITDLNLKDGISVVILETIAKATNFKVNYTISIKELDWGILKENGTSLITAGIMNNLLTYKVDIGIGTIGLTPLRYNNRGPSVYMTLPSTTSNTFAALLSMSVTQPNNGASRIFFFIWVIFCFHLTTWYQTSLISVLTRPSYEKQIAKEEDIFEQRMPFGFAPTTLQYFTGEDTWKARKISKEWIECTALTCLNRVIYERNFAYATTRIYLAYLKERFLDKNDHSLMYTFKQNAAVVNIVMMLSRGFPLIHRINILLARINEAGLIDLWLKNLWMHRYEVDSLSDQEQILTLYNLQAAFIILGFEISSRYFPVGKYITTGCIKNDHTMDIIDNLFSQQKWTIFIKTPSEEVYQSEDSAITDNYIIYFRDEQEFYEILMYLKRFLKWNPAAKFIVTSGTVFENPYEVAVNITSTLWSFRVTHYVILLVNSSELQLLDIYTWHPYTNGHCADQFNDTKVVNQCKDGVLQYDTNLFPVQMLNNLNGCTVNAEAIKAEPYVFLPTDMGKNITDLNLKDGISIIVLETIAKATNFKVNYTTTLKEQDYGITVGNGSTLIITGIIDNLVNNRVDIDGVVERSNDDDGGYKPNQYSSTS
ncbi:Ionotropic receptor 68a [Carabus blaptoides fortunei]